MVQLWLAGEYGRGILRGIGHYLRRFPVWDLHVAMSGFNQSHVLIGTQPDGFIGHITGSRQVAMVHDLNIPAVNVSGRLGQIESLPSVVVDNLKVGGMAAEYFLRLGFKHLAYCGEQGTLPSDHRGEGFRQAVSKAGLECFIHTPAWPADTSPDVPAFLGELGERIASLPRPLAIMGFNDLRAHQIKEAILSKELRVPEDVALIGADNDEVVCNLSPPGLSSVEIPLEQIGYKAAELLDQMMEDRTFVPKSVKLSPVGVVSRQSTDVYAIDDRDVMEALRFIRNHVSEPIQVQDVVRNVSISRRSLQRKFLRATARTIDQEINHQRIQEAQRLLKSTDLSVFDVTRQSGFQSAEYFSKAFRKSSGMTPTAYRKQFRHA
jgi:LacI family transcriptional regulator